MRESVYSTLIGGNMERANNLTRDDAGLIAAAAGPYPIANVLDDANRALTDTPKMDPPLRTCS